MKTQHLIPILFLAALVLDKGLVLVLTLARQWI